MLQTREIRKREIETIINEENKLINRESILRLKKKKVNFYI